MRRVLPLTILIVVIGGLIAAAAFWGDNDRWDRDHNTARVVQVVDDQGQPVGDGSTVIIERGGRPFFFPFGFLFVPLFLILLFWAIRGAFWRGGGPGFAGPSWTPGTTPPPWFEHWYQQMQQRDEQRTRRDDLHRASSTQDNA